MTTKLEAGQKYQTKGKKSITIGDRARTDLASLGRTGATFIIDSTGGWYYGDGPLIGKWQLNWRTIEKPGEEPRDLDFDFVPAEPERQLSLFD